MSSNDSLTSKQRRAIAALISEPTQKQAAASAGIAEKTLYRWLADDRFRAALAEAETQAINEAIRHLVRLQAKAAQTIEAILDNPKVSPGVRLRAALGVFNVMVKLREFATLEARIAELERVINEQSRQPPNQVRTINHNR